MRLKWVQLNERQWSAIDGPWMAMIARPPQSAWTYYWEIDGKVQGAAAGIRALRQAKRDVERTMSALCGGGNADA